MQYMLKGKIIPEQRQAGDAAASPREFLWEKFGQVLQIWVKFGQNLDKFWRNLR